MHNLLLDIGNSEIKIGEGSIDDGSAVSLIKRFRYDKRSFSKDLKTHFPAGLRNTKYINAAVSVLNKENHAVIRKIIKSEFGITVLFISNKIKLPVRIDYSEGLGNDRICSATAASLEHRKRNILVVDFGTATTYTLVINKTIKGGLISPGIGTSLKSLLQNTDLPEVLPTFPEKVITKNSVDNIRAGVMYGALFSAEGLIKELSGKYRNLYVIFTGGFSGLIYERINNADEIDRNLVMKGINHILNYENTHK